MVLNFSQRSLRIQYKLASLPPSKYAKTLLYLGIRIKNCCGFSKCLHSQQDQTLRKILAVPSVHIVLLVWDPLPTKIKIQVNCVVSP